MFGYKEKTRSSPHIGMFSRSGSSSRFVTPRFISCSVGDRPAPQRSSVRRRLSLADDLWEGKSAPAAAAARQLERSNISACPGDPLSLPTSGGPPTTTARGGCVFMQMLVCFVCLSPLPAPQSIQRGATADAPKQSEPDVRLERSREKLVWEFTVLPSTRSHLDYDR